MDEAVAKLFVLCLALVYSAVFVAIIVSLIVPIARRFFAKKAKESTPHRNLRSPSQTHPVHHLSK